MWLNSKNIWVEFPVVENSIYFFNDQKVSKKKRLPFYIFLTIGLNCEKCSPYGGLFFDYVGWDICIYWSMWGSVRALFIHLPFSFRHARIDGYLLPWYYLCNTYIYGMANPRNIGVYREGYPGSEYPILKNLGYE
jgi:hypothetical protein